MSRVVLLEDGKLSRGVTACLVKRRGKEVLIRRYDADSCSTVEVWFMKYKKSCRGVFYHKGSNLFYYEDQEGIKHCMKEYMQPSYYNRFYGPQAK